jgi:porin
VKIAALGIANAMLSFGLLMTEAHANETETSQPPPAWVDLRLNFTAQPVVGIAGGLEPSASSWMQQVAAGLTLGTGLDKHRSNWTGFDHWQIQLELNQFTGNPKLNLITPFAPRRPPWSDRVVHKYQYSRGPQRDPVPERSLPA